MNKTEAVKISSSYTFWNKGVIWTHLKLPKITSAFHLI